MYIATVPNRKSPPAILIRESYREGGKSKSRTLANITHWEPERIEALSQLLKGKLPISEQERFEIVRSLPHGHVAAVVGTVRKLGLERLLHSRRCRERDLVVAMTVARILEPASKLATARSLSKDTLTMSLGECLGLEDANEDELYAALDWLLSRQPAIERKLALGKLGYSRDGKKGKLQVLFGLLCEREGRPIGVEVFEGNTGDPRTLGSQIRKIRESFGLSKVVFVGDRGMITEARIREELRPVDGLEWITSMRAPQIRRLVQNGVLQPSLFDELDLAEIHHPDFPNERLIACRNPLLAAERSRKRKEMLVSTESKLEEIRKATKREKRPLRGKDAIGMRVGRLFARCKMGKHFRCTITEESFDYELKPESIKREAELDGIYIVRTSLNPGEMSAEEAVETYKGLAVVERAFRSSKTVDLHVRPIYHYNADRVRAHIFLCMLAYYVEWHMRKALAPILFDDHDPIGAKAKRASIVSPAKPSNAAQKKASTKKSQDGLPVHSFRTLLSDLATLTSNKVENKAHGLSFVRITRPTPVQQKAFDLLGVDPRAM
jgi:hypothetical protein